MLHFVLGSLHLVNGEDRGQCYLGALACGCFRNIVRYTSSDSVFGAIRLVNFVDVSKAACHGRHVNGGVPTTHDNDPLADMAQAPVIKGLEERCCRHAVGCIGAFDRQGTAGPGAPAQA